MKEQYLYFDCVGSDNDCFIELCESTGKQGLQRFRGKFQEAEAVNKNKRMYSYDVLQENVDRLMNAIKSRKLIGELDHPTDSIIHFTNASHVITNLWWEGKVLMGEAEILDTASGLQLKRLIEAGIPIGISSRGVGNGKVNEDGILVIGESYKLITFDAVADPSTHEAYQTVAPKDESYKPSSKKAYLKNLNTRISSAKNENTGIDKINNVELLIAYFGGCVNSQSDKLKSRLG